ncbi:MAG: PmoA family protein [Planctomycetaceae bacterium]
MTRFFTMIVLSLSLAYTNLFTLNAHAQTVSLTEGDHQITVKIADEEFTTFQTDPKFPKPFFAPVRGPGGTVLSRPIVGLDANPADMLDHVHHKGIWLSVDEINGNQHWAEKSKIVNVSTKVVTAIGNPAILDVVNHWVDLEGKNVVTESTQIKIFANRLVTYDITFSAGDQMVIFEDTKEGLFGFRMVDSMREKVGGRVTNADGLKGTAECWGKTSAWVDYCGEVDGKTFGVAIFDHPMNFRPSRYHVRDYGLFSVSPFGEKAYTNGAKPAEPAMIPAGGTLRLRYGMFFHTGETADADVDGVYRNYLSGNVPGADQGVPPANDIVPESSDNSDTAPPVESKSTENVDESDTAVEESECEDDDDCDCCGRGKRRLRRCRGC